MSEQSTHDARHQALGRAIADIEPTHAKDGPRVEMGAISTGAPNLDIALGVGGIPRGRLAEVYGPASGGKTTLCLHLAACAQETGGVVAFIDAEHALDMAYARTLGVDTERLVVSRPSDGEQALDICNTFVSSGAVDLIVVDSVAALVPRAELEGGLGGDEYVGLQARLMGRELRRMARAIDGTHTCVVFTNQIRERIGAPWGAPETTPGGRALKFHASVRLDIRHVAKITDGASVRGHRTCVKVVKNSVAPPFKQVEFDVLFGFGIDGSGVLLDLAIETGVAVRSGAWFEVDDVRLGNERDEAAVFLSTHQDLRAAVRARVQAALT